jgi:hypothetical protein
VRPTITGIAHVDHVSFAVADDTALNAWGRYRDEIGIALEFYLLRQR